MAGWRERLQPASWRGVSFYVDAAELEAGRRVVLHEYPLRDLPSAQDLGRAQRKISVTAYVLGADYLDQRDRLLAALEQPGAGSLQLPTWPAQQMVLASPAKLAESKAEGGICRLSLSFAEAGEAVHPQAAGEGPEAVASRTVAGRAAARDAFIEAWKSVMPADGGFLPSAISEALGEEWTGLLNGLANIASDRGALVSAGGILIGALLGDDANALIDDGKDLAEAVLGVVAGLIDPVAGTEAADPLLNDMDALAAAPVWGDDLAGGGDQWPRHAGRRGWDDTWPDTAARRVLAGNRAALAGLVQQAVLVERCRHLSQYQPASSSGAVARRDALTDDLDRAIDGIHAWRDEFASDTGIDTGRADAAMAALTRAVLGAASALNRAAGMADLVVIRLPISVPAIVLAYDRYEDERRADDIITRNVISHPLVLPVDQDLEVMAS